MYFENLHFCNLLMNLQCSKKNFNLAKVKLPRQVSACVSRIVLRFRCTYFDWPKQAKYLQNAMQYGKRMCTQDVATHLKCTHYRRKGHQRYKSKNRWFPECRANVNKRGKRKGIILFILPLQFYFD